MHLSLRFLILGLLFLLCSATVIVPQLFVEELLLPENIKAYEGKKVQVRGFWYPLSNQEGFLAAQSNLKSCCVGNSQQQRQQLLVRGEVASFIGGRVINLEGVLQKEVSSTFYSLEEASLIPASQTGWGWIIAMGLLGGCSYLLWRKK